MFAHLTPRQRLGYVAIGGLFLVGMGFIGAQKIREPAPIVFEKFQELSSSAPVSAADTSSTTSDQVVVHVVGEVRSPGIVRLGGGARVMDAIQKAGGGTGAANLEALNLAAKLVDGMQLRVPSKTEALPFAPGAQTQVAEAEPYVPPARDPEPMPGASFFAPQSEPRPTSKSPSSKQPPAAGVSVNTATLEELDTLPGVGPVTAQRIIEHREMSGGFRTVDELLAVKGIGPKKLEQMRPFVRL